MSDSYQGILRVMDPNGFLLDIGSAGLQIIDSARRTWGGELTVSRGSCLDKKSLTTLVETTDGTRSLAQIGPTDRADPGRFVKMDVVGLGEAPF